MDRESLLLRFFANDDEDCRRVDVSRLSVLVINLENEIIKGTRSGHANVVGGGYHGHVEDFQEVKIRRHKQRLTADMNTRNTRLARVRTFMFEHKQIDPSRNRYTRPPSTDNQRFATLWNRNNAHGP